MVQAKKSLYDTDEAELKEKAKDLKDQKRYREAIQTYKMLEDATDSPAYRKGIQAREVVVCLEAIEYHIKKQNFEEIVAFMKIEREIKERQYGNKSYESFSPEQEAVEKLFEEAESLSYKEGKWDEGLVFLVFEKALNYEEPQSLRFYLERFLESEKNDPELIKQLIFRILNYPPKEKISKIFFQRFHLLMELIEKEFIELFLEIIDHFKAYSDVFVGVQSGLGLALISCIENDKDEAETIKHCLERVEKDKTFSYFKNENVSFSKVFFGELDFQGWSNYRNCKRVLPNIAEVISSSKIAGSFLSFLLSRKEIDSRYEQEVELDKDLFILGLKLGRLDEVIDFYKSHQKYKIVANIETYTSMTDENNVPPQQTIKVNRCPNPDCREEIKPHWIRCPVCGASLKGNKCDCGEELKPHWMQCPTCGRKLK